MQLGKLRPREQKELIKVQERMRSKARAQTVQNEKATVGHRPPILLKQNSSKDPTNLTLWPPGWLIFSWRSGTHSET